MILALTVSLFPSCGSDNLTEKGQKENDTKQLDLLKKEDSEGVFFKILAQDSLQTITISKKGIVYASMKPNVKIVFPYEEPLIEGEGRVYRAATANEKIEIVIYKDDSARSFLDGRFDHSVAVSLSKKDGIETDFACFGHYLYDKKLSGNWVFKAFENKKIEELGINQIPLVCIDVNTRSFSGSGGNHMIYGDLRCEGDGIAFKIVLSPDYVSLNESKEKELLEILEECDRYELDGDDLNLFIGKELKLQFFRDTYNV
ncbi:hypothetical protein [Myroides sp. DW712]|uniref:hypothetical protein n=1 Tax=Myroides sp. DW712 TaxID=3389800 RepID=UPI00397B4475